MNSSPNNFLSKANSALIVLACALLLPAGARAAVTYYFDWYCSGCAKLGKGTNGREGPFGSGPACEGARASLGGSLATRGCGSRCFNPQPCVSSGQDVIPSPPAASVPAKVAPAPTRVAPIYDPLAERVRHADEVRPAKKGVPAARDVAGKWRNSFSRYEARSSKEAIIYLTKTGWGVIIQPYIGKHHGRLPVQRTPLSRSRSRPRAP